MKKINFLAIIAAVSLMFTSCSSEDSILSGEQSAKLLKKYKINRDATGAYSVDLDVAEKTKVDDVLDVNNNTKQYFLYSSDDIQLNSNISQELLIDNNQLKVGIVDANTNKKEFVSIIDDDFTYLSKSRATKYLADFSVQSNQDGTFDLSFNVNKKVNVSFEYNEEISTYEVHLERGKGGDTAFSRTLEVEEGQKLKIDFVNYVTNEKSAKSSGEGIEGETTTTTKTRKPRVIIDNGGDDI